VTWVNGVAAPWRRAGYDVHFAPFRCRPSSRTSASTPQPTDDTEDNYADALTTAIGLLDAHSCAREERVRPPPEPPTSTKCMMPCKAAIGP
jgi:hypothetical protein